MVALQQNLWRRKLNFSIYTFPTFLFKRPNVKIKVKEDEYEEIPNVADIAELQVSAHEVEFRLRNLNVTKPVARMEYQHPFSKNVVVVLHQLQFTRKALKNQKKITDQYFSCLLSLKYLTV